MFDILIYYINNTTISLFFISIWGLLVVRSTLIVILMSIELGLLAMSLKLLTIGCLQDTLLGQIFALFVLTVAAGEAAIGLAILVSYYRLTGSIELNEIVSLKG